MASKALEKAQMAAKNDLKEIEKLKSDITAMEKEKAIKQKEINDLERITSPSRDAHKMYGDITPGDTTHKDVVLSYVNHFKDVFRNMPGKMSEYDNKYKVWELCAKSVQDCFEKSKEFVIDKMVEEMRASLTVKSSDKSEEMCDLRRAFKMLLDGMTDDQIKEITDKIKDENAIRMIQILKENQPENYVVSLLKEETH